MDEPIANIEPKLWNAIQTMTRSKSEVRGTSKLDDPTSQAHTELSLPQDTGPHRSLPQTAGCTDLSLTQTTGRTELSLPQDYGLHSSLSPSRLWAAQISLSLRLLAAQSSLSLKTTGCTEQSLPQTADRTELSLPHSFLYHVHTTGSSLYDSTCLFNNSTAYIPQNRT